MHMNDAECGFAACCPWCNGGRAFANRSFHAAANNQLNKQRMAAEKHLNRGANRGESTYLTRHANASQTQEKFSKMTI